MYVLLTCTSPGPFLFIQKRMGKNKKIFSIYKIRTMQIDAERQKNKYRNLNEADGPVFKIRNDPRYTKVGKFLSHTGLDELPQLINIIKGDMLFVGPRPLPVDEAKNVPPNYQKRFTVLPGITSPWVVQGSHNLSFDDWMESDLWYVENRSWRVDIEIAYQTIKLLIYLSLQK